jgi:predicted secreted protein
VGVIRGKDFMFNLVLNGNIELLCRATDFTMNTSTEELETTGPNNGRWRSFLPGMMDYTLSVSGIVSYTDSLNLVQLQELQDSGAVTEWIAGIDQNGGLQYEGFMFITSISNPSQFRDVLKFDMTARGTNQRNIRKNPVTKTVYLADTQGIRLPGCPNPYPVGILWYDGTLIGVANNADDVLSIFNAYSATQGNYLSLIGSSGGCDFIMTVAWNSPLNPTFILAVTGGGFALAGYHTDEVIGESDSNQNIIGV